MQHKIIIRGFVFKFYIFLFFLLIIGFFIKTSASASFAGDDIFFQKYSDNESIFDSINFFKSREASPGLFFCRFFASELPLHLNIHPNDFIGFPYAVIKGIFAGIVLLSAAKFFTVFIKLRLVFLFACIFTFVHYISALDAGGYTAVQINYPFYRYFFPLLFFSLFWYHIHKNILIKYKKNNSIKSACICLCACITGISNEILFFVSALLLFFIFLFRKYFNLGVNFYLPAACFYASMILFIFSPGYINFVSFREIGALNISFDLFNEFNILYFIKLFAEEYLYWQLFIITGAAALIAAYNKKEMRKMIFPFSAVFSILITMYSLIFCGKKLEGGHFFLEHSSIIFLYKMLLIYPLGILFSYVIRLGLKKMKIYAVILMCILTFCISLVPVKYISKINQCGEWMEKSKKMEYILQKMILFYYKKNKNPELPDFLVKNYFPEYLSQGHRQRVLYELSRIYKDSKMLDIELYVTENALDKYYAEGCFFSRQELKNIKFSRLFSRNLCQDSGKMLSKEDIYSETQGETAVIYAYTSDRLHQKHYNFFKK